MTIADHRVHRVSSPPGGARVIEVRWSSLVSAWNDRLGACEDAGPRHARVELVLRIEPRAADRAIASSWLELNGARREVLASQEVACIRLHEDGLEHVDLHERGNGHVRLAALSFDARGRVLYAQSPLLAEAGLPGGTYNPPSARNVAEGD
jgi:hypothetical protein